MNVKSEKTVFFLLILIGAVLFFPFLGQVHLFDWDEANFAEIAREMIRSNNYLQPQINYLPFYEKPPLFIWFQVLSMKLFGINEFAARFPNAICGIFTICSLYWMGNKIHPARFGLFWVMTYLGSLLPFLYFRTGLIDPWFNYFMMMGIFFYYQAYISQIGSWRNLLFSAFMLGLAILTKGPVALLLVGATLAIAFLVSKGKFFQGFFKSMTWLMVALAVGSIWFVVITQFYGNDYIYEFVRYQIRLFTTEDALHGGPIYYHLITLWVGCFPAVLFIFSPIKNEEKPEVKLWRTLMIICLVVVVVIFSIVKTKIIHYSSMAYFPITYLAAYFLYQQFQGNQKIRLWQKVYSAVIIGLMILVVFLIPLLALNLNSILPLIKDADTLAAFKLPVFWTNLDLVYGLGFVFLLIALYYVVYYKFKKTEWFAFAVTPLLVLFLMITFLPRLEVYIQGPLIEFAKSKRRSGAYFLALPIKSYAMFFYADVPPFENTKEKNHLWLLYGPIDKKTYFVSKPKKYVELVDSAGLKPMCQKGAFLFLERDPLP